MTLILKAMVTETSSRMPKTMSEAEGAWGDDDLDLEGDGDGDEFKDAEDEDGGEGDGWAAEDDDLELPELEVSASEAVNTGAEEDGYFVAPTRGAPPPQQWTNNSTLPVDHVLAGNMESACRLLHDQVGVVEFGPYKSHFMSTLSRASTRLSGLPSTPSLPHYPLSNWRDATPRPPCQPLVSSSLTWSPDCSLPTR